MKRLKLKEIKRKNGKDKRIEELEKVLSDIVSTFGSYECFIEKDFNGNKHKCYRPTVAMVRTFYIHRAKIILQHKNNREPLIGFDRGF